MRAVCIQLVTPMAETIRMKSTHLRPEAARQRFAEQHHHDQQQRQQRQRQEQVGQPHQNAVKPLEETRHNTDQGAKQRADQHCGEANGDRDLSARHHAASMSRPSWSVPNGCASDGPGVAGTDVDEGRLDRPQQRADGHRQHDEQEHRRAEQCALVGLELVPDIPPLASGRRCRGRRWRRRIAGSSIGASVIADPRVKDAVEDIGDQVEQHDQHREDEGQRLHHRQVVGPGSP
jgi:hypothetical protein